MSQDKNVSKTQIIKTQNAIKVVGWLGSSGYQVIVHSSAPKNGMNGQVKHPSVPPNVPEASNDEG